MDKEKLIILNDRLADVLVCTKGFKCGVKAMPNGNTERQKALLDFIDYIEGNLNDSKKEIRRFIS